ncbi:NADH-quinone oxidoreductase subunit NuoN [Chitinophaga sp. SYP-B3965]|uniref:NADH-quinone oxidoreductase subunit N n=1 Tax=Chitinophaga sp. SYP-B3965 TaxID=2663120 RepID=UPI001299907E|nr:NADH-quinone oxidoreductase subunit N [Chitinophaga sp. SYP-B3965]MRG43984.1 NADH-quinone oxidoreductase subunit NuoN [Chitinophaga sp. SYP-B3965]
MSTTDLLSLMPLVIISGSAVIAMLLVAIKRNHRIMHAFSVLAFMVAILSLFVQPYAVPYVIAPLFVIDAFAMFNTGLILVAGLSVLFLSFKYFEQREERKEEYYILLLLATVGGMVLVISQHFISLFLGLETMSISLYGLIAYLRARERSDEAGIKYLLLAALSSAFLLFGMALVYAFTGTMEFEGIGRYLKSIGTVPVTVVAGFGLMMIGVGFKLGIVPFHMWTPDIYEGAPLPVAAYIATVSKGSMLVLLMRFYRDIDGYEYTILWWVFAIIAMASMFVGNWLALLQQNVKRLLAYSSIAHMGYILIAFLAGQLAGQEAVIFYLVAYVITSIGAFGVLAILSDKVRDAELLEDFSGLFWRHPWLATVFTGMLLSLAGIPLTAGFIGKFYIIAAGVDAGLWLLLVLLVVNSVIGLFYYIRIIAVMFQPLTDKAPILTRQALPFFGVFALSALMGLLIWLGVYPSALIALIRDMMLTMG